MAEDENVQVQSSVERFIALANSMKDEGARIEMVSWALMSASALYATYSVAGNEGGLTESGVDKVTEAYRHHLQRIQEIKRRQSAGAASPPAAGGTS
jgi:hypothetical protein